MMMRPRLPDGSSPPPWGTLHGVLAASHHERFIPTPVGNTHRETCKRLRAGRFIPTPVGNTRCTPTALPLPAVHPHPRGEHRHHHDFQIPHHRFIPTPVGNTLGTAARRLRCAVHPHPRGEHWPVSSTSAMTAGSSPPPWGTRVAHLLEIDVRRFIPTPVGNTRPASAPFCAVSVHPHPRGEHIPPHSGQTMCAGSSPPPWGTRRCWV